MTHSIRGRLTVFLLLSLGLLFVGSGAVLYSMIHAQLIGEFDRSLLDKAKTLITLTENDGSKVEIDIADRVMPEFAPRDDGMDDRVMPEFGKQERPEYFILWLTSGPLIAKSPSLGDHELPRQGTLSNRPVLHNIVLPNGLPGRLLEITFVPRLDQDMDDPVPGQAAAPDTQGETDNVALDPRRYPEHAAVLLLARDRQALDALLHTLQGAFTVVFVGLLAIMVALVRSALRVGLRPLDDVRHQVDQLDVGSLTTGIQVHTRTTELIPVVTQLNALLRRLDAAFVRERQFSSDVAHELRTPLAELRTLTEVGMRWPDDTKAVMQYFTDTHAISLHMERIVLSLLTLARCESGRLSVHPQALEISEVVETSWSMVARLAQEKHLTWHCRIVPECALVSDRNILQTILGNLLDNAVTYSPPWSEILCSVSEAGDTVLLTLRNPTESLTQEDVPHVFERFWRKDPARTSGDHTGLGLAIVQALAVLLNLKVRTSLDAAGHFTITLAFRRASTLQPSCALQGANGR